MSRPWKPLWAHFHDFTKISLDFDLQLLFVDAFKPTTEEKAKDLYTERSTKMLAGGFGLSFQSLLHSEVFRLHAVVGCA